MYALARLADPDIQAEAATVIANVTSTVYEAQIQVCNDNVLQLLLYLSASEYREVQASATRALANLTQSVDCEPAIRKARAQARLERTPGDRLLAPANGRGAIAPHAQCVRDQSLAAATEAGPLCSMCGTGPAVQAVQDGQRRR